MIGNLQILRAFAATGVVFLHSNATIFGIHTEFHGVALFFVLSGYLMCRIRDRPALSFMADRFWRIVPVYWLATAVMLWTFEMWTYWPIEHTVLSFLFIPHQSPSGLHPVLGVGWTLNFEMYFYVVFAVALSMSRRFAPILAAGIIAGVYFAVPQATDNEAVIFYYGGSYVWYFVAGMAIWYFDEFLARCDLKISLPWWTLPAALLVYVVLTIVAASGLSYPLNGSSLAMLLPPALFAISVVASRFGADLKPLFLIRLGNASYACYLLHTILIELMRHRGVTVDGSLLPTAYIIVTSWIIALFWYLFIEKTIAMMVKSRKQKQMLAA